MKSLNIFTITVFAGLLSLISFNKSWAQDVGEQDYTETVLDNGRNYIYTVYPQVKMTTISPVKEKDIGRNVQYYNGLGYPVQSIGIKQAVGGKDVIQIIDYDQLGRQIVKYMPYARDNVSNNGAFIEETAAIANYKSFYLNFTDYAGTKVFENEGENNFTSVTEFDDSPLNRVVKQGAPGLDWQLGQGHEVGISYLNNSSAIKIWEVAGTTLEDIQVTSTTSYAPWGLYLSVTTDENQKVSKEYKNKLGQVILTENDIGGQTWYVYDSFGLLRCVIPPAAEGVITTPEDSNLDDKYCYYYSYDERKRMIEKKIPGAEAIYMVYDKRDRLVLTQDGNMRGKDQWMATLYDNLNRPKKTGIFNSASDAGTLTGELESNIHYLSTQIIDELSETFYDNYTDLEAGYTYIDPQKAGYETTHNPDVKGQITFTKTWVPDMEKWLVTVNYYDHKYRVIQTIADNHLGGRDIISNKYDFVGKVDETIQQHTANDITETITKVFIYDHAGRLTETKMDLGGTGLKTVATNEYNELGQLKGKNTHNSSGVADFIKTSYGYNIRGWMITMGNKDKDDVNLFTLGLGYNQGNGPQYNGNISLMKWSSYQRTDDKQYDFSYDDINRLTAADYSGTPQTEDYSTTYSYDKNGNILKLHRFGWTDGDVFTPVDSLNYGYVGNQLAAVNDVNSALTQELLIFRTKNHFYSLEVYQQK